MQNQKDIIIITAAGKATWLRERLPGFGGWSRWLGEGLVGGYKDKMDILRGVDERIYAWLSDFKHVVKQMRKAAAANRLVDVALLLHNLNTKLEHVQEARKELKTLEEKDLEPFDKEYEGLLPDKDLFSVDDEGIVSEAGLWSDFKRRWVANHLETEKRRTRKLALDSLVKMSETLSDEVENYLSEMSKARASGNIGKYIDVLDKLSEKQLKFKENFMPIYVEHLAPIINKVKEERKVFLDRAKRDEEERLAKLPQEKTPEKAPEKIPETVDDTARSPVPLAPESIPSLPSVGPGPSSVAPTNKLAPTSGPSTAPAVPPTEPYSGLPAPNTEVDLESKEKEDIEESGPRTLPSAASTEVEKIMLKQTHVKFVEELVKVAVSDDPYLISAMLLKYAEEIEDIDLEKSLELLAIAEGIINEQ